MTWEYRLAEKDVEHNHPISGKNITTLYGIVEVYYDKCGKVEGWTNFIDPNGWTNVGDLKLTLEKMVVALSKPVFEHKITDEEEV